MNTSGFGAKPAILRCGRCGKFVDWQDARLQVICRCRPHMELPPVAVREASPADREKALELFMRDFGPAHSSLTAQHLARSRRRAVANRPRNRRAACVASVRRRAAHPCPGHGPLCTRRRRRALVAEAELLAPPPGPAAGDRDDRQRQSAGSVLLPAAGVWISAILRDSIAAHTRGQQAVGFAGIPIPRRIQLAKEI